jgi:hypothetical protein
MNFRNVRFVCVVNFETINDSEKRGYRSQERSLGIHHPGRRAGAKAAGESPIKPIYRGEYGKIHNGPRPESKMKYR